jgi:phenylpropionate dioxygenase-like ring-hydroxylating dioxygenase large terminal subunit
MGDLFRRFWLPALKLDELPEPDCPPIRFRILGENLVAFRDSEGRVAFVAEACPHRGASLFFGRNEESGLRCVYHGWKFDINGACVDMPSEPAESNFRAKVHVRAYAGAEWGGLIWIYMGPADKQPSLPHYEFCLRQDTSQFRYYKWLQESNYAQSLEGNIDTAHIGFLHRRLESEGRPAGYDAPVLQLLDTDFGFVYGGRRPREDGYYWRVTPFVLPTFTSIPNPFWGGGGIFVIPQDDEHCWWWTISEPQPFYISRGLEYIELIPGTWRQTRNKDNDYLIDREMQRSVNFTGLPTNRVQDAAVTESMGTIYDRSSEHLGTSDQAIIYMRRHLIRLAQRLQQGIEPAVLSDPELFRVRPINVDSSEPSLRPLWQQDHAAHLRGEPLPARV